MTVIVKHNKTNSITDWTQAQLDEQIALGNFPSGTTLANIVLPSDWNNDHTLTGLGTMAEQDATAVAITGGTINNTTIGATTATTGKFTSVTTPSVTATTTDLTLSAISTGNVNLNTARGTGFQVNESFLSGTSANYVYTSGRVAGSGPVLGVAGSDTNTGLFVTSKGTGSITFTTNNGGTNQFIISNTASAVNYVQVTGAATGGAPAISAQGSDTNSTLSIASKGTGAIRFDTGGATAQFRVLNTASAVNRLDVTGSATGFAVQSVLSGTDTNISMAFQPKGTGAIDLAAGSSGVNISNGGTVTAITRTATGSGYTSFPSIAISAPTTAGGTTATASVFTVGTTSATVASGGTGYTVGNIISTNAGASQSSAATFTVTAVSSGVITAISSTGTGGSFTAIPTNPVATTGGSGSGATLNLSSFYIIGLSLLTAGSGYIEQPTVTFSGGGGSGAAAYATVGSFSTIKSLGVGQLITSGANVTNTGFAFFTPNTAIPSFLIRESGGGDAFLVAGPGIGGASLYALGAANSALFLGSNGTSRVSITTNGTSAIEQLRVNHTTSAVNYVQVTGAATGNEPQVSAQGSDTNVTLQLAAKGANPVKFLTGGSVRQAQVSHTASAVNYINFTGSIATAAPVISVLGTDTNIDLALTPKGTGNVRFGTYTASMALTVQGYIEIKDSGGTIRKLAVIS